MEKEFYVVRLGKSYAIGFSSEISFATTLLNVGLFDTADEAQGLIDKLFPAEEEVTYF